MLVSRMKFNLPTHIIYNRYLFALILVSSNIKTSSIIILSMFFLFRLTDMTGHDKLKSFNKINAFENSRSYLNSVILTCLGI